MDKFPSDGSEETVIYDALKTVILIYKRYQPQAQNLFHYIVSSIS